MTLLWDLGRCTVRGPCVPMRARMADGAVRAVDDELVVGDYRVRECPWCGEPLPAALVILPAWQRRLRPPDADGQCEAA